MSKTQKSTRNRIALLIVLVAAGLLVGMASRKGSESLAAAKKAAPAPAAEVARLTRQLELARSRPAPVPEAADEDELAPGAMALHPEPEEQFAPRPAGEWRGMLVNEAWTWPCSAQEPCTQARACVNGRCMACRADSDCLGGEACVLDHCVQKAQAQCRSFTDCESQEAGSLCVLSSVTHGTRRGNEDMRAYCLAPTGG